MNVSEKKIERVCPVELAGGLDTCFRRLYENPGKILGPYINKGMTVLDMGCGPGYFSVEMARMVSAKGRVIAADLQEGMLDIVKQKIAGTGLEERIILHKCETDKTGIAEKVDFILMFYVVHEIPDAGTFFGEMSSLLKPEGRILVVEPPFHVSKKSFENTISIARNKGLVSIKRPRMIFRKAVLLGKDEARVS